MPKYRVVLERQATAYLTVEIEAPDQASAESGAETGHGRYIEFEAVENESDPWIVGSIETTEIAEGE